MPKVKIFIGSSSAARTQARLVVKELTSSGIKFLPWWNAFIPGRTLLEELDAIRTKADAAILLFSPESETTVRKQVYKIPNLNVLFEFGYFYGYYGKSKVAILRYGDFYLPSDLGGYICIHGSKYFRRGKARKMLNRTKREFTKWVENL